MLTYCSPKKYDATAQKLLKSKIKPEPWMHVVVLGAGNFMTYKRTGTDPERVYYAIYVWDTREVLDANMLDFGDSLKASNSTLYYFIKPKNRQLNKFHAKHAKDNRKPLVGKGDIVLLLNRHYFFNETGGKAAQESYALESQEEAWVIEYSEFGERRYVGGKITNDSYGVSWTAMKNKDTGHMFDEKKDAEAFIRKYAKRFQGTNPKVVPVEIDQ